MLINLYKKWSSFKFLFRKRDRNRIILLKAFHYTFFSNCSNIDRWFFKRPNIRLPDLIKISSRIRKIFCLNIFPRELPFYLVLKFPLNYLKKANNKCQISILKIWKTNVFVGAFWFLNYLFEIGEAHLLSHEITFLSDVTRI